MRLLATFAAISITASSIAQAPATFTDPANLRGERVKPRDGRELPIDQGALGLQQLLRKLNTRASILNIVAHPDDEDGGMLTVYARGFGARVADISLTRGEGGQNAVTGDFEDALGLLRTQELLANDRYVGVDQMFGTEVDFGFSKTKTEAFAKWTHERVLYDVVRAIRLYRPLVLTSTWIGAPTDGHGQHQVSGQIAQEAFVAAGDPKVFPELTAEGILPWQPLRVYARVPMSSISDKGLFDYATGQYVPAEFTNYVTGKKSTTPPSADVLVHEGAQDLLLTRAAANAADVPDSASQDPDTPFSYVQFARIGLSQQRSQMGPGFRNTPKGAFDVSYHLYGNKAAALTNAAAQTNFFDGIDTSIESIAALDASEMPSTFQTFTLKLHSAMEAFDVAHPAAVGPVLADALASLDQTIATLEGSSGASAAREDVLHELRVKRAQLNDATALAFGLTLDASTTGSDQVAGTSTLVTMQARAKANGLEFPIQTEWLQNATSAFAAPRKQSANALREDEERTAFDSTAEKPRIPGRNTSQPLTSSRPYIHGIHTNDRDSMTVTRPYFTRNNIETPVYQLLDEKLRNAPSSSPAMTAWIVVRFRGQDLLLGRVVHDGPEPLAITPAYSVTLSSSALVLPKNTGRTNMTAKLDKTEIAHAAETIPLTMKLAEQKPLVLPVSVPGTTNLPIALQNLSQPTTAKVSLNPKGSGISVTEGFRAVGYGNLPRTNIYTPATTRIVPVDLKFPARHHIAYLPGTGDSIAETLASIGFIPTILNVSDLVAGDLKQYDTIILGVRTYTAHSDLHGAATKALLDYARNGGNVVVQFQTTEFTGDDAPFPLSLGTNEKVVDETAPVKLLSTANALLTTPNRITPADFDGWNEERGHGFLSTWDNHYTALTETHDPGAPEEHVAPQLPQRGGLITVQLGKGRWTYCAFALYRQLPEANPGAFRLFMNLINP